MYCEITKEQQEQEIKEFEKVGIKNLSKAQKRRYTSLKEFLKVI